MIGYDTNHGQISKYKLRGFTKTKLIVKSKNEYYTVFKTKGRQSHVLHHIDFVIMGIIGCV